MVKHQKLLQIKTPLTIVGRRRITVMSSSILVADPPGFVLVHNLGNLPGSHVFFRNDLEVV